MRKKKGEKRNKKQLKKLWMGENQNPGLMSNKKKSEKLSIKKLVVLTAYIVEVYLE